MCSNFEFSSDYRDKSVFVRNPFPHKKRYRKRKIIWFNLLFNAYAARRSLNEYLQNLFAPGREVHPIACNISIHTNKEKLFITEICFYFLHNTTIEVRLL